MIAHAGSAPRPNGRSASRVTALFTAALLLAIVGVAWWQTITYASRMSGMLDGLANSGRTMPFDTSLIGFAGMWGVMMAAMMVPGIIGVAAAAGGPQLRRPLRGAAVAAGYLAVWMPTAVIAFGALGALNKVSHPTASLHHIGGAVIALAGAYQFTGWKRRLLAGYRDPDQNPGVAGAFGVGITHGLRCLGCSWVLMSVLLVVGVMNVAWMAAIAVICLGEKALPRRTVVAAGVGVSLIAVGAVVLVHPQVLDVIAGLG